MAMPITVISSISKNKIIHPTFLLYYIMHQVLTLMYPA